MDTELIKMCDTPEIQDRWEPKVGDRFIAEHTSWVIGNACFIYTGSHDDVPKRSEYPVPISGTPNKDGWGCEEKMVYIPRIEDVLEWLGDRLRSIKKSPDGWVVFTGQMGAVSFKSKWAKSLIKALLKAYMHLEHNKTWNGEAWA